MTSLVDIVGSSLAQGRDDVLLKEGLQILSSISCVGGIKGLIRKICESMPKLIAIVALKHVVANPQILLSLLKSWSWIAIQAIFYRRQILNFSGHSNYVRKVCEDTNIRYGELINLMPLYIEQEMVDDILMIRSISYMAGVHSSFMSNLNQQAAILASEHEQQLLTSNKSKYQRYTSAYGVHTPMQLYPSRNFKLLESVVRSEIETAELLKSYAVFGILIDGEPGLGKSSFADHIANANLVKNVYRADLNVPRFLNKSDVTKVFNDVFNNVPITGSSLFVIDEMDKYLNHIIKSSHNALIDEAKKNEKLQVDEVISFEEHRQQKQAEFINSILAVLERPGVNHPCIVIFCSNNFNTIFSDLDMTHFNSTLDRFAKFRFERMNKQDVVDYLEYHNTKFENTRFHCSDLKTITDELNADTSITARQLHQITKLASYNFKQIITDLNQLEYPIAGSSPKLLNDDNLCDSSLPACAKIPNDVARVIESYDEGIPVRSKQSSNVKHLVNQQPRVVMSVTSDKPVLSSVVPPTIAVNTNVQSKLELEDEVDSEPAIPSNNHSDADSDVDFNSESDSDSDVESDSDSDANSEVVADPYYEIFNKIEPDILAFRAKVNPDISAAYSVVGFRCSSCGIGRMGGVGFCDCSTCDKSYEGLDLVPGTIVTIKCHRCLTGASDNSTTSDSIRLINTNPADKNRMAKCIRGLLCALEKMKKDKFENKDKRILIEKEVISTLFRYIGSAHVLSIINQPSLSLFRLTVIDKAFEFFKDNAGFVSANLDIFSSVCEKLLPVPTKIVKGNKPNDKC